jgi:hypothetical protein
VESYSGGPDMWAIGFKTGQLFPNIQLV